jgi:hypothetical protein
VVARTATEQPEKNYMKKLEPFPYTSAEIALPLPDSLTPRQSDAALLTGRAVFAALIGMKLPTVTATKWRADMACGAVGVLKTETQPAARVFQARENPALASAWEAAKKVAEITPAEPRRAAWLAKKTAGRIPYEVVLMLLLVAWMCYCMVVPTIIEMRAAAKAQAVQIETKRAAEAASWKALGRNPDGSKIVSTNAPARPAR